MNNKLLTMLGFAAKAGKLSYGMNATLFSIKQKKAKTVLVACDISPKSQKEVNFHCEKFGVKAIVLADYNTETISKAVGKRCGIISVNDIHFANTVREEIR